MFQYEFQVLNLIRKRAGLQKSKFFQEAFLDRAEYGVEVGAVVGVPVVEKVLLHDQAVQILVLVGVLFVT